MMAAVILVCSLVLMLQFFISYCRSLIAASSKEVLPIEVQEVTGISRTASSEDFRRVVQLLNLCPDRPDDRSSLRAVAAYYLLTVVLRSCFADRGINLSKLESRPADVPWTYRFFLEFDTDAESDAAKKALADLASHAASVRVGTGIRHPRLSG